MTTVLTTTAAEEGTYVVVAAFTDEDDAAVVPDTVTWTLTNATGTVINSRLHVAPTPASTISIVLSGDDLKAADGLARRVTVEATYTSNYGSGLPLNADCTFHLEDLVHIPD